MDLEKEIEELIKKSLENKQFVDSVFFDLPLNTQIELKKILFKNFVEDKKTKKPIYAIEFYKKYNDKTVKAVKIHLRKEKILRLKTLFIPKK